MKYIQEFLILTFAQVCYAATAGIEFDIKNNAIPMLLFNDIQNLYLNPLTY